MCKYVLNKIDTKDREADLVGVSLEELMKPFEELYGTWVNTDYNAVSGVAAKKTFAPDETWANYKRIDTNVWQSGKFTITHRWRDHEGNIWYKLVALHPRTGNYYFLAKVTNSGTTSECASSIFDYPATLESNSCVGSHELIAEYSIYYRQ